MDPILSQLEPIHPLTQHLRSISLLSIYLPLGFLSDMIYDMIYLTAIGLTPGGSSTVHIYTQTIQRTTQSTQTIKRTTQFTN